MTDSGKESTRKKGRENSLGYGKKKGRETEERG